MDKKFIDEMQSRLIEERKLILITLAQKDEDFAEIASTDNLTDYADIASSFTDQQLIENIGSKDLKRLKQIDAALLRITANKYGKCISCKKEIPQDRLRAIPQALKCIECQENDEKRKKST